MRTYRRIAIAYTLVSRNRQNFKSSKLYKVIAHVDCVGLTELDEGCLPIPEIRLGSKSTFFIGFRVANKEIKLKEQQI